MHGDMDARYTANTGDIPRFTEIHWARGGQGGVGGVRPNQTSDMLEMR